jgi:hypothetical protein
VTVPNLYVDGHLEVTWARSSGLHGTAFAKRKSIGTFVAKVVVDV